MRILLLCHSFNSLTQRVFVELRRAGHDVSVEFDVNDSVTEEAVALFRPELIVAPFLRRAIPQSVWSKQRCIVLHPGIEGDRGPSALDWAIMNEEREWGVTALQATGEMDAGDIWGAIQFSMREATKASLYRNEVTEAAVAALELALSRLHDSGFRPKPLDYARAGVRGRLRPLMRQENRRIDWRTDDTASILRRIRAADGVPGVLDSVRGVACYLYDAHVEDGIRGGRPGDVIARRGGAILRATLDGALWITHLKRADGPNAFKLPACIVLDGKLGDVPELPLPPHASIEHRTWRPIRYEETGDVGWLHCEFYNGAMGTQHCAALREACAFARLRPTRVIVLAGGEDFWSNGIHLNLIEASAHPAEESWRNINAMNELVREIVTTDRQVTIAALAGNAGAGGVFLALAADRVWARDGIVLNPHYKSMGNLYGSEYWTYLLPRRVAPEQARAVVQNRLPVGVHEAAMLGLIDEHFGRTRQAFRDEVQRRAIELAGDASFSRLLDAKNRRRADDEATKPLERYREEELERLRLNFFGFDSSYHVARYNFVHKVPRSRTPLYLAKHRDRSASRSQNGSLQPVGPA